MARVANTYKQVRNTQARNHMQKMLHLVHFLHDKGYTASQITMMLAGKKVTKRRVPMTRNNRAAQTMTTMRYNTRNGRQ